MPTLAELRNRIHDDRTMLPPVSNLEEALVADLRGRLRPAQMVEQKLRSVLPGAKAPGAEPLALAGTGPTGE